MNLVGRILQHVVHTDTGCWIYSGGNQWTIARKAGHDVPKP